MNFYKIVGMIAIVMLIICLAVIGTALAGSEKNVKYPPHIAKCPDTYVENEDGACVAMNKDKVVIPDCADEDFGTSDYSYPGIGRTSGLCAKKLWAKKCMVDWDGITNNGDICYGTSSS